MKFRFRSVAALTGAILAASATWGVAADLPARGPLKAPAFAPYDWTGVYVGGHIGGGWINQSATFLATDGAPLDPAGTSYGTNHSGFLGGAQIGYNYQIQSVVLGIGADIAWTNSSADTVTDGALVPGSIIHTQGKTEWLATLTGRLGYAWNNWLVYGKAGAAWAHEVYGGYAVVAGVPTTYNNESSTRTGWTVGTGVEWAFAPKWSIFVEYDYLDFGTKNINLNAPGVTSNYDVKTRINVAKLGVNLRF